MQNHSLDGTKKHPGLHVTPVPPIPKRQQNMSHGKHGEFGNFLCTLVGFGCYMHLAVFGDHNAEAFDKEELRNGVAGVL